MATASVIILTARVSKLWVESFKVKGNYSLLGHLVDRDLTHKQLLPVNGEPILGRLIRQYREQGSDPVTITRIPALLNYVHSIGGRLHPPKRMRWEIETALHTRGVWGTKTVIVFGDVIFTEAAVRETLSSDDRLRFYGRESEIFAFSFTDSRYVEGLLKGAVAAAETNGWGTFWDLYNIHLGHSKRRPRVAIGADFTVISDQSQDIDRIEYYLRAIGNF